MASSGAKGLCAWCCASDKSWDRISFILSPGFFLKPVQWPAGLLGVSAVWSVSVWFPVPLVLVFCVVCLAILPISAVPPLEESVKIGRRVKFLILDLSMSFNFGIFC